MTEIIEYDDADTLWSEPANRAFLESREAEHGLIIGLLEELSEHPERYEPPYLAVVRGDDEVLGVALRTPPRFLVLSYFADTAAAGALAREMAAGRKSTRKESTREESAHATDLPGVTAQPAVAEAFLAAWEDETGATRTLKSRQRIHATDTAEAPAGVAGELRAADANNEAHRDRVRDWLVAFNVEAFGHQADDVREQAHRRADQLLSDGAFYLWERDGCPVSMAAAMGATPNGIRISYVYTPPEHRERGYGSAVTAGVTRRQLQAGRDFCTLFTDLANPTSNHIYAEIGYEAVCDMHMYGLAY